MIRQPQNRRSEASRRKASRRKPADAKPAEKPAEEKTGRQRRTLKQHAAGRRAHSGQRAKIQAADRSSRGNSDAIGSADRRRSPQKGRRRSHRRDRKVWQGVSPLQRREERQEERRSQDRRQSSTWCRSLRNTTFPIGETPLVDRHEVAKYEIGQKVQQIDMEALQSDAANSHAVVCRNRLQPGSSRCLSPEEARSSEPDVNYIYFRTAEEKPADVTLKDARPQIVEFWKKRKAFELAMSDAQKLAEKAKGVGDAGRRGARSSQGNHAASRFPG